MTIFIFTDFKANMKINFLTNNFKTISFGNQKPHSHEKVPVYIIDREGRCQKFPSINQTKDVLHVTKGTVNRAFNNGYDINDCFIVKANDIEDENGQINQTAVKDFLKSKETAKNNPKGGRERIEIYTIDKNGEFVKYPSMLALSQSIKTPTNFISHACKHDRKVHGYLIKKAKDVENEDGKVSRQKIREILETHDAKNPLGKIQAYTISPDGTCVKYESLADIAKQIGCLPSNITIAHSANHRIKSFIIKHANEIEDENGNIDEQKVKEILIEFQKKSKRKKQPIYVINLAGEYRRFNSISEFEQLMNLHSGAATENMKNGHYTKGFIVKKATEIEDENGNPNQETITQIVKTAQTRFPVRKKSIIINAVPKTDEPKKQENPAIYAINIKTGKHIKFPTSEKVAETFGLHKNSIQYYLTNMKQLIRNYMLVRASKIEDENGSVDEAKIKSFIKLT